MITIGSRLAHIRGTTDQRTFAKTLGVAAGTLSNYERDARAPTAEFLRAIATLGWNPTWVLTGSGPERLAETVAPDLRAALGGKPIADERAPYLYDRQLTSAAGRKTSGALLRSRSVDFDDYTFVPHLCITAAAGQRQVIESEQIVAWLAFRRSYLQMLGVPAAAACLIRVRDDSMDPELRAGDTVLVDSSDITITTRPRVFALRLPGTDELAVKRACKLPDRALSISGAAHWPTSTIPPDASQPLIIGRVRWSGRIWE